MKKFINIAVLIGTLGILGFTTQRSVVAASECQGVTFTVTPFKVKSSISNPDENKIINGAVNLVVRISTQDAVQADSHKVLLTHSSGSTKEASLVLTGDPPGSGYYTSTTAVEVDKAGSWSYILRKSDGSSIASLGSGCTGTAEVNGDFSNLRGNVTGYTCDDLENAVDAYSGNNSNLYDDDSTYNHFTCTYLGGSYNTVNRCAEGEPDMSLCSASGIGAPSDPYYTCLPCSTEDKDYLDHLEVCDPNDDEVICDPSKNLKCDSANGGPFKCVVTSNTLFEGASCYYGISTECHDSSTFYHKCEDQGDGFSGICRQTTVSDCNKVDGGQEDKDAYCKSWLAPNTPGGDPDGYCEVDGSGFGQCKSKASTGGSTPDPGTTPFPGSNQFGEKNCPWYNTPIRSAAEELELSQCKSCLRADKYNTWVSGVGCINTTPEGIFTTLVRFAMGVMGGVALIRMIILGYRIQGKDDKQVKEAKEGVISTLGAIVLVLLSVIILRVLGVNILGVVAPGFFGS